MTERIYYTDPYAIEFEAIVDRTLDLDGRTAAILDRTAFYPTSGGQPYDTGTLDDVRVIDVIDREDGSVVHLLERPIPVGRHVTGRIDWPRRFDHMQQHTGQHVLSAAFDRTFGARTMSFHLGAAVSTIDLSRQVSDDEIARAEEEANRVVWDDRPVTIRFATAEEAAGLPLRKEAVRSGPLRLIEIHEFDLSACGGTHVSRTGAIGIIAIAGAEKFRGGTRVEFVCGGRALRAFRSSRASLEGSLRLLSVLPAELPAAIERLQAETRELKKAMRDLQERLALHEASALAGRVKPYGTTSVICEVVSGADAQALKAMAVAFTSEPRRAIVLLSDGSPSLAAIATSGDVDLDASALLKDLTSRFGGRGGGKPDLAQGAIAADAGTILAAAREAIAARIGGREP
jgi:alanyl-tRNA synthetase